VRRSAAWATALAAFCVPIEARAQPPTSGQTAVADVIADVRIHGNHLTSNDEILALSGITLGAPFLAATIANVTARLERSGRFDDVEVLQRYASIADPTRILVVIVVNEGPVRVRLPDDPDAEPEVVPRRGLRNFLYMPILDAEDGYGLTYGIRLARPGVGGAGGRLSFPVSWGGLKQVGAEYDRAFDAGPLSRIEVGAAIRKQTNPAYDIDDSRRRLWTRVERQAGPVRVGAGGGWQRVSFADLDDDLRTVSADVIFDTRLTPVLPRNAVYTRAGVERVSRSAGGGDIVRTSLDARVYLGLVGQTVLEARVRHEHASRAQPPYLRSLLGGWSSLRGFEAGAFTGDTLAAGTLELHVPLSSVLSAGKVGTSVFFDAGGVQDHGGRLADTRFRVGSGASVWVTVAALRMSLAVAHGRGAGTRVNFGGGFVF
jgi:outer membrane protein assembly factor BamA